MVKVKLDFQTVEEAREAVRRQIPELVAKIDVEREIRATNIWDILQDLERGVITRSRAEIILREHFCDVVQGTPQVEEKYGDADRIKALEEELNKLKEGRR